jgi:hypothetical protein
MTAARTRWSTELTDRQRSLWDIFGHTYPTRSTIAGQVILSGQQAYCRINIVMAWNALPWLDDPPDDQKVFAPTGFRIISLTASPLSIVLTFDALPPPDQWIFVQATPPLRAGIRAYTRHVQYLNYIQTTDTLPVDFGPNYPALGFPSPVAGQRLGFTAYGVNTRNGALSARSIASGILA